MTRPFGEKRARIGTFIPPTEVERRTSVDIFLVAALGSGSAGLWELGIGLGVTFALCVASVLTHALTPAAAVLAALFGLVIITVGGPAYLALLVLFVIGGTLATRYAFDEKLARKVSEGKRGERGVSNVLAHIIVPLGIVLLLPFPDLLSTQGLAPFVYTSALACGASDTFASEFGVLSGKAYSILGRGPVAAGTNGGVSLVGEVWAFVGSLLTVVVGGVLFEVLGVSLPANLLLFFVGATVLGFVGCQIDSVLGETLENRGYLTKGRTNFLAMLFAALIALGVFFL